MAPWYLQMRICQSKSRHFTKLGHKRRKGIFLHWHTLTSWILINTRLGFRKLITASLMRKLSNPNSMHEALQWTYWRLLSNSPIPQTNGVGSLRFTAQYLWKASQDNQQIRLGMALFYAASGTRTAERTKKWGVPLQQGARLRTPW